MARPIKNNADYHSHDANMRNDIKIKALRRKYKLTGYAVYNMMLEVLTNSEHFEYKWNDFNIELLAGDFEIEPELLIEIIDYCSTKINLFTIDNDIIYSYQHKERFKSLLSKRKSDRIVVIDVDNTQSKVKESKVKEIKVDYDYFIVNGNIVKGNLVEWYLKNHQPNFEALLMQLQLSNNVEEIKILLKNYFINGFSFNDYKHIQNSFKKHIIELKPKFIKDKPKLVR